MRLIVVHHVLDENACARLAVGLANHLVTRGHSIRLIGAARTGEWHLPVAEEVELEELTRNERLASSLKLWFESVPKLWRMIRDADPDVVVSIGTLPNIVAMTATTGSRHRLIVNEQTDPREMSGRRHSILRNTAYRFRHADAFVVPTQDTAAYVRRWMRSDLVHVIPNPATHPDVRRTADASKPPIVVAMGRLVPQKGFDMLLDAWAAIARDHPEWRLVIAGEGPLRGDLEQQVRRLGIAGTVTMPGYVRDHFALLAQAELFVLSSRYEGFPLVLVEAMATALPVVAMDCPSGPLEIVRDGVDGFLVPLADVQALAAAMSKLMRDRSQRDAMSTRALETADRFRPERVWALWEQLIERVVGRAS